MSTSPGTIAGTVSGSDLPIRILSKGGDSNMLLSCGAGLFLPGDAPDIMTP